MPSLGAQWRLLSRLLALFRWARSLCKRHVLVDRVMHRQVALGDGVGAVRLVLVDQLMHVRTKDVLGVLIDILFIPLLAQDGRSTCRAAASRAADANAREQLKARYDGHRKAPAADGLAA